jgi:hypothetical protein
MQIPGLRHAFFGPRDQMQHLQEETVMEDTEGQWVFEKPYKHPKCKESSGRIKNGAGKTVFSGYLASDEDGRRIVACVNACEGISTNLLEEFPRGINGISVVAIGKLRDLAQAQRDELLAAAKLALDWLVSTGADGSPLPELREAIAKAEATHG